MLKYKYILVALIAFTLLGTGCRKSNYLVEPDSLVIRDNGAGIGNITLEKGKKYILEGKVFVNDGQVLTIEPGAVIRFRQGAGTGASALIVARGGKIMAEGTAVNPIIFTAESDELDGSLGETASGLWGGVILLGAATINTPSGEAHIEGISLNEDRAVFGGPNDNDDSGILRYVSIRYGGSDLGQDNEINGLTLGGVGRGTIIENIEIFGNADDGIELFGGTVNLRQIVVTNCHDDALDIDLGYRGNIQFACLLQHPNFGDRLIEIDGGEEVKTAQPYSLPILYNITAVGRGADVPNRAVSFIDNAGGTLANSVFINQGRGIEIEYSAARMNSFTHFERGTLNLQSLVFYNINQNAPAGLFRVSPLNDEEITTQQTQLDTYFGAGQNRVANPNFKSNKQGISLVSDEPFLKEQVAALPTGSTFFESAPYVGAFGTYNWVGEWTLTQQLGLVW